MAKFWRAIRKVIQNIPIPGVGVSIQQAKDLYSTIKTDPGGTVVYEPPASPTPGTPIGDVQVRRFSIWFFVAVGLAAYLFLTKEGQNIVSEIKA